MRRNNSSENQKSMAVLKMTPPALFIDMSAPPGQRCAFTVRIVNPPGVPRRVKSPSVQRGPTRVTTFISRVSRRTDASAHASKLAFPPVPPLRQWLVTNVSVDVRFLCSKVHVHLKNINLFPSLVASPQKHDIFFFLIHFWRGTNPNVRQALALKAQWMNMWHLLLRNDS